MSRRKNFMNIFPVQKSSLHLQILRKASALRSQPGTRTKHKLRSLEWQSFLSLTDTQTHIITASGQQENQVVQDQPLSTQ